MAKFSDMVQNVQGSKTKYECFAIFVLKDEGTPRELHYSNCKISAIEESLFYLKAALNQEQRKALKTLKMGEKLYFEIRAEYRPYKFGYVTKFPIYIP